MAGGVYSEGEGRSKLLKYRVVGCFESKQPTKYRDYTNYAPSPPLRGSMSVIAC